MTSLTAAPPAALTVDETVEAETRAALRRDVHWFITVPLMVAIVGAQVWASMGGHGFAAWSFGSLAGGDGQWWEAWFPVALTDVAVFITAHAATRGMLGTRGEDRRNLLPWAWTIAGGGFGLSLAMNLGNRTVALGHGATMSGWQTPVALAVTALPVVLILASLVFHGKVQARMADLAVQDLRLDATVAERQRAAELEAQREAAAAAEREARRREREARRQEQPAAPATVPAPAPVTPAAVVEEVAEPHPITGDVPSPTDPKVAVYDRAIAAEWAAGRNPDGAELDRQLSGAYGRKQLRAFRDAVERIAADRGIDAGILDEQVRERHRQAKGTAARALAYVRHQEAAGGDLFPRGLAVVPDADTGETETVPADGNAA